MAQIKMVDLPLIAHFNRNYPDKQLVNEASHEGQMYRKSLILGKWAVVISTGFEMTKIPQYLHLVSQYVGFAKLFVVEERENLLAQALMEAGEGKIVHIPISLRNRPSLVQDVVQAIDSAVNREFISHMSSGGVLPSQLGNKTKGIISAVFTIWDDAVSLVARVQREFDMDHCDIPTIVDVCHDKRLARQALEQAGVPGPKNFLLTNLEDAKLFGKEFQYPVILKPINGAASIGVSKINDYDHLVSEFSKAQMAMDQIYESDELMGLIFTDGPSGGAKDEQDLRSFVIEEFIGGPEFDCDIIISDGECVYANINEDWQFKDGWMCERGMNHPALIPKEDYLNLWASAAKFAGIIGCKNGVYHVEMKLDPYLGPQMIECNPRMGGAAVWQLHRNCWEVDLLFELSLIMVGLPSRPVILEEPLGLGVSLILFSDESGILREDMQPYNHRIISEFKRVIDGGIVDFLGVPLLKGCVINGWEDKLYPTHIGRLDLFYPKRLEQDPKEAIRKGKNMRKEVRIPLESGDHADPWL